ncbi:MAG TPA: tetratricopeptide repeat protein, partial [Candidatus Binatia bacterium]|nr:tetratricopeptide repeat protein [Candidatus Binatia bacterium]
MKALRISMLLPLLLLVIGCASLQNGSNFQAGRRALLRGDNETALAYFQTVAQRDPDYTYGTAYQQGVLSYLGRTEYLTGKLPQARQTLERALSTNHQEDDLTRLYLGLALARGADRARGLKEMEVGMRGIYEWIEYITEAHRFSFGQYWDPGRDIRTAIENDLRMLSGREPDMSKAIASGEWIAKRMEEEEDKASRQESREQDRDSDGNGDTQP